MKKLILTLSMALFCLLNLMAQRGLEAGAVIQPQLYGNVNSQSDPNKAIRIPYSFAIGVDVGYNLSDNIGIRTGLLYMPIGEKYNDVRSDPEARVEINLNYLQAPLYLKYNSNPENKISLLLIAGGYIGFLNDALMTVNDGDPEGVLSDYERIVPGGAVGAGIQLNLDRGGNINFLLRSSLSLGDVHKTELESRNFAAGFQLSYHYFIWEPM